MTPEEHSQYLAIMLVELLARTAEPRTEAGKAFTRRVRQAIEGHPEAVAEGEANYRAYKLATAEENKPDGTLESLLLCARMLDEYGVKDMPANPSGQVDFIRAMMESTISEIRAFVARQQGDA